MIKISVSQGNSKMGMIPSISLPPVVTCRKDAPCVKKCYAAKIARLRKTVDAAYKRNLLAWKEDPDGFKAQAIAAAITSRFFRWHVAGDIVDSAYFSMMCDVANKCPGTQFLIFTKRWDIVNKHVNKIPDNLQVVYSAWPGLEPENPYNLPVAHVIMRGTEPDANWKICAGNCAECACAGIGCWELKNGEHIAFYEH